MSLLPVEDALERLLKSGRPPDRSESVPLHEACDRVLAVDVAARLTQPPFDNSAMDGYALRHEDIVEPGATLRVIGRSAAGHAFSGARALREVVYSKDVRSRLPSDLSSSATPASAPVEAEECFLDASPAVAGVSCSAEEAGDDSSEDGESLGDLGLNLNVLKRTKSVKKGTRSR